MTISTHRREEELEADIAEYNVMNGLFDSEIAAKSIRVKQITLTVNELNAKDNLDEIGVASLYNSYDEIQMLNAQIIRLMKARDIFDDRIESTQATLSQLKLG